MASSSHEHLFATPTLEHEHLFAVNRLGELVFVHARQDTGRL
jgi:hypothetical protein